MHKLRAIYLQFFFFKIFPAFSVFVKKKKENIFLIKNKLKETIFSFLKLIIFFITLHIK